MTTLVSMLLERANEHPSRIALIEASGKTISYGELANQSAQMAAHLQTKNIEAGDRILVAVWPSIALYKSLAALWRIGASAVFPEAATGLAGLCHAAKTMQPKAMIAGNALRLLRCGFGSLRGIKQVINPHQYHTCAFAGDLSCASSPALISFTSGTTGQPKAMMRNHALLQAQHQALSDVLADKHMQTDLVAFPAIALSCLGHGHQIIMPRWNLRRHDQATPKTIWQQIEQHQITRLIVPPVIVENLTRSPSAIPANNSLKQIITGGGPFYPDMMRQFTRIFPQITLHILYGSTEAEPISHLNIADLTTDDWQAAFNEGGLPVGRISPYTTLRFDETGEIQVSGPHVNDSYLDKQHNAENKLLHEGRLYHCTGDIGRLDEKGNLWLMGRKAPKHFPQSGNRLRSKKCGGTKNSLGQRQAPYPFALESLARLQPGINGAATIYLDGHMILAVSGQLPAKQSAFCQYLAAHHVRLIAVKAIPRDHRHRSKPDYKALEKLLRSL